MLRNWSLGWCNLAWLDRYIGSDAISRGKLEFRGPWGTPHCNWARHTRGCCIMTVHTWYIPIAAFTWVLHSDGAHEGRDAICVKGCYVITGGGAHGGVNDNTYVGCYVMTVPTSVLCNTLKDIFLQDLFLLQGVFSFKVFSWISLLFKAFFSSWDFNFLQDRSTSSWGTFKTKYCNKFYEFCNEFSLMIMQKVP